jgi:hypothetical protein
MNEREVTALLERRAAAVPTSDPAIDEILHAARRDSGPHRHRTAFLAAAAVLALLLGIGIVWDAARDEMSRPSPVDRPLPVNDGYRWVGMNGIAVEVPLSWATDAVRCGKPSSDTVVFHVMDVQNLSCGLGATADFSVIDFEVASTSGGLQNVTDRSTTIDGVPARIGDASRVISLGTPDPADGCSGSALGCFPLYSGAIYVPSLDVVVWVESPHKQTVTDIVDGARVIPDGYVAVPDVTGMQQSVAADTLGRQGLAPDSVCPHGAPACDGSLTVDQIFPLPGSVVPAGSHVAMYLPSLPDPGLLLPVFAPNARLSRLGDLRIGLWGDSGCRWQIAATDFVSAEEIVAQLSRPDWGCAGNYVPTFTHVRVPFASRLGPRFTVSLRLPDGQGWMSLQARPVHAAYEG